MKLNEKQTHALEEIYRVARMYTKIAAELNKVADTIELESEKNDEEFMKVKSLVPTMTAAIVNGPATSPNIYF